MIVYTVTETIFNGPDSNTYTYKYKTYDKAKAKVKELYNKYLLVFNGLGSVNTNYIEGDMKFFMGSTNAAHLKIIVDTGWNKYNMTHIYKSK